MKIRPAPLWLLVASCLGSCAQRDADERAIVRHSVATAHAVYADALADARSLDQAAAALIQGPSAATLESAREAWRSAHRRYSLTEGLRFGHWIVDDWETRVNAWPVEEGLLDYVNAGGAAPADNPLARANLVANDALVAGQYRVDTKAISTATMQALNGLLGIETNVATGYHAIEFYLWGQDQHGNAAGAGERPWTDYAADARCTRGRERAVARECVKRGQALRAVTQRLVLDLQAMVPQWADTTGSYGARLAQGDPAEGLRRLLFGMGSLALQEMAGERIRTALLTGAPEEEQDCFSDDTHQSLRANALGIEMLYFGRYVRADGTTLEGPSLDAWLERERPGFAAKLREALATTHSAVDALVAAGETGGARFDQLIAPGNVHGHALLTRVIDALTAEARAIEDAGTELGLAPLNPAAHR